MDGKSYAQSEITQDILTKKNYSNEDKDPKEFHKKELQGGGGLSL